MQLTVPNFGSVRLSGLDSIGSVQLSGLDSMMGSTEWARFDDGLDSMGSVRARLFHVLGLGSIVRLLGLG